MRDLLPVLDALDRADAHWRQVLDGLDQAAARRPAPPPPRGPWPRWLRRWLRRWLFRRPDRVSAPVVETSASLARSADEGIQLIRESLLEALRGHGLEPFDSVGLPFDPERMQALGQRPAPAGMAAGLVVEEAVRGYIWRQNLLREAQVLVSGP